MKKINNGSNDDLLDYLLQFTDESATKSQTDNFSLLSKPDCAPNEGENTKSSTSTSTTDDDNLAALFDLTLTQRPTTESPSIPTLTPAQTKHVSITTTTPLTSTIPTYRLKPSNKKISIKGITPQKGKISIKKHNASFESGYPQRSVEQQIEKPKQFVQTSTHPQSYTIDYTHLFEISGTDIQFKSKWFETLEKAKTSKKRNYVVNTILSGRFRITEKGMEMLPEMDTSKSNARDLLTAQWNGGNGRRIK